MYKLIAIDVDDTLITDEKEVTPGTQQALKLCIAQGIMVTLAMGRMYASARHLAQHFGCSLAETIAIGDSWNDHDMIEVAGLGVAMNNAVASLKAVADYVTLSNNEEGVRHVIEKFVLCSNKGTR